MSVTARFAAAHQLRRRDGSAEPLHEHDWRVSVTYAGDALDDMGLLVDFQALRRRLEAVLGALERESLNGLEVFAGRNPSAENLAAYVARQLGPELPGAALLSCVEVEEAPGCVARYWPAPDAAGRPPCG